MDWSIDIRSILTRADFDMSKLDMFTVFMVGAGWMGAIMGILS